MHSNNFDIIEKLSLTPYKLKTLQISKLILFLLEKFFTKFSAEIFKDEYIYLLFLSIMLALPPIEPYTEELLV